jgi:hypothetical protein
VKTIYRFFPAVFFTTIFFLPSFGQNDFSDRAIPKEDNWSVILFMQGSHIFSAHQHGMIAMRFPYTIRPVHGTIRAGIFNDSASANNNGHTFIALPGLEVIHNNFSVDAFISPFSSISLHNRWSLGADFNYRFPLHEWIRLGAYSESNLKEMPVCLSVGFVVDHAIWKVGEIGLDSTQEFTAFGHSLMNTEDTPDYGHGHVYVCMQENIYALTPALSFGIRPEGKHFDISFRVGAFIPLIVESGASMVYRDDDKDDVKAYPRFEVMDFHRPGLHATFNGEAVPRIPFRIDGLMLSVRVGFFSGNLF